MSKTTTQDDFRGTARFGVIRRLGAGGAGIVYEAHDRELGVRVALKRLRRLAPDAILRFKSEFRAIEDVEHPNLVGLGELFEEKGQWFITMEFVDGVDLLTWIRGKVEPIVDRTDSDRTVNDRDRRTGSAPERSRGPTEPAGDFDEARLRSALAQLLRGLDALHAAGKVHRDVKPSNVLVTPEGRVVLLDFGLATDAVRTHPDEASEIVGTLSYMSPEQGLGIGVDARADMYSLGVVLYRSLTGRLPVDRSVPPGQTAPITRPGLVNPATPDDLDDLCMDLLRVSPELRPTAREALARIAPTTGASRGSSRMRAAVAPRGHRRFVGREYELAVLREAFDETLSGDCVVVAVGGESGLGKSTLVRHFGEIVAEEYGAVVLSGRCYERESVPYKAVDGIVDALGQWMARLPRAEAESLMPPQSALLAHVFAVLRPFVRINDGPMRTSVDLRVASANFRAASVNLRAASVHMPTSVTMNLSNTGASSARSPGPVEPREQRAQLFASARALLSNLAARLPVVLVIDDLQWSDPDGLALLHEMLRPPDAPSILLLATARPTADRGASATSLAMRIREDARTVALAPLAPSDATALALDVLAPTGHGASASTTALSDLAEAIVKEAGGHPLFIDALARSALGAPTDRPLRLRLEDALVQRFDRLDPAARRVLELSCVAGSPIAVDVIHHAALADDPSRGETFQRTLRGLQIGRLVRTLGEGRDRVVEPYHDKVRDAVLGQLDAARVQDFHLALAEALEASASDDADALASHFEAAGALARAARWIERAADRAVVALAFDRAAHLYRSLLAQAPPDPRALQVRLAEALVAAGRGVEAADTFLEAAEGADARDAYEYRRRAAEQLLTSGHIDRGMATLKPVLDTLGLRIPTTRAGAAASLAWGRARLAARGLSFREKDEAHANVEALRRVDALNAAAQALGMVDNIRGADLQTRQLLAALDAGEPKRLARALALEASFSATAGTKAKDHTRHVLGLAQNVASRVDDPLILAALASTGGLAAFLEGRWIDAREQLLTADLILREQCSGLGVAFAQVNVSLYMLGALLHIGELDELGRRLPSLLDDAEQRGDLYALTQMRAAIATFMWLSRDEPVIARKEARRAISAWTSPGTHMPHFFDVLAQGQIDLYEGDAHGAHARVEAAWPLFRRAMLLRLQFVRVKMLELRARSALAVAARDPARGPSVLRGFGRDVEELAGERAPWADALCEMLCAGRAALEGDHGAAVRGFEACSEGFRRAGMGLHAAVARSRATQVSNGDPDAVDPWFAEQKVVAPRRLVSMLAPARTRT